MPKLTHSRSIHCLASTCLSTQDLLLICNGLDEKPSPAFFLKPVTISYISALPSTLSFNKERQSRSTKSKQPLGMNGKRNTFQHRNCNKPWTGTKNNLEVLALLTEQSTLQGLSVTLLKEKRKQGQHSRQYVTPGGRGCALDSWTQRLRCRPGSKPLVRVEVFQPGLLLLEGKPRAAPASWAQRRWCKTSVLAPWEVTSLIFSPLKWTIKQAFSRQGVMGRKWVALLISGFSRKADLILVQHQALGEYCCLLACNCALQKPHTGESGPCAGTDGRGGLRVGGMCSWSTQRSRAAGPRIGQADTWQQSHPGKTGTLAKLILSPPAAPLKSCHLFALSSP